MDLLDEAKKLTPSLTTHPPPSSPPTLTPLSPIPFQQYLTSSGPKEKIIAQVLHLTRGHLDHTRDNNFINLVYKVCMNTLTATYAVPYYRLTCTASVGPTLLNSHGISLGRYMKNVSRQIKRWRIGSSPDEV